MFPRVKFGAGRKCFPWCSCEFPEGAVTLLTTILRDLQINGSLQEVPPIVLVPPNLKTFVIICHQSILPSSFLLYFWKQMGDALIPGSMIPGPKIFFRKQGLEVVEVAKLSPGDDFFSFQIMVSNPLNSRSNLNKLKSVICRLDTLHLGRDLNTLSSVCGAVL